jgi:hypothetical protein
MTSSAAHTTLRLLVHLAVSLPVVNVYAQRFPGPGSGGPPGYGPYPTSWPWTDSYSGETIPVTIPPVPTPPDVPPPPVIPTLGGTLVTVTFVDPPPLASTRTLTIQAATGTSANYPASPSSNQPPVDIRISSTAKQCEPFHIHYNLTSQSDAYTLLFDTPDRQRFLSIRLPTGVGCMEWVCNVHAGYSFYVSGPLSEYYVVQPGSSSACLNNIMTTYAYAEYNTNVFQSFTAHPPNTTPPPADFQARLVRVSSLS